MLVIRSKLFIRLCTVEMIYIRCNSLITQYPMSRIYEYFFLSRYSLLTLGLRSQFPSIVEQIYDTPSRPGLGGGLHFDQQL